MTLSIKLGKYTLLEEIGRGGYGTVYRARDEALQIERAVKVLHPTLVADPTFIERFREEARLVARLKHPHIVPVYDLGEDQGRIYLTMEYMSGGSLKDLLDNEGSLTFSRALEILRQVAGALDYAHNLDLVHRDIKPGNILFDADGRAHLTDFGFAKSLASADNSSTMSLTGGILGTPAYMSPEAWDGQGWNPAADIYSLACVFFEMLMGRSLFGGDKLTQIFKQIMDGPQYPENWPPGVPREINIVLEKGLANDLGMRYANAGVFVDTLMTKHVEERERIEAEKRAKEIDNLKKELLSALKNEHWSQAELLLPALANLGKDGKRLAEDFRKKINQVQQEIEERAQIQADKREKEIDRTIEEAQDALSRKEWRQLEMNLEQIREFGEATFNRKQKSIVFSIRRKMKISIHVGWLKPWNPWHWIVLCLWLFIKPDRLMEYRERLNEEGIFRFKLLSSVLSSILYWLPFAMGVIWINLPLNTYSQNASIATNSLWMLIVIGIFCFTTSLFWDSRDAYIIKVFGVLAIEIFFTEYFSVFVIAMVISIAISLAIMEYLDCGIGAIVILGIPVGSVVGLASLISYGWPIFEALLGSFFIVVLIYFMIPSMFFGYHDYIDSGQSTINGWLILSIISISYIVMFWELINAAFLGIYGLDSVVFPQAPEHILTWLVLP